MARFGPIGPVLQPVVKGLLRETFKNLEYAYAGAAGTAIGIGSNPEVRQLFEYYKGKNRYVSWKDKYIRKRFKGDVLVESPDSRSETLRTGDPGNGYSRYSGSKRNRRFKKRHFCRCRGRSRRFYY